MSITARIQQFSCDVPQLVTLNTFSLMFPSSAASFILLIGHFHMFELYDRMSSITFLRKLVYVYGMPYIEFARTLYADRSNSRFLRNLVSQLECHLEQEWYPTPHLRDPTKTIAQKIIIDIIEDLLHINDFPCVQGLNVIPEDIIRRYKLFFTHWTSTAYSTCTSSWNDVAGYVFGIISMFEIIESQRLQQYNACVRALRAMPLASIDLVPAHILLSFGVPNSLLGPGTEYLYETSSQTGASESDSDIESMNGSEPGIEPVNAE